ncbi:hypothetical protein RYX36_027915 [Vicia faba]
MEFKFRAVDIVKPTATSHSPSPVAYLPDRALQGGFSGFRSPLTGEEALRRELEKEQIRREILRRMELEEEVRRELAIERELGISIPRPLNIHGLVSQWSNSVAVGHIGASQPQLILPPTEIKPSPEISNEDKVIVLTRPDPELYNAKRKATTLIEIEPSAFGLKKKLEEEWSCALCEIKATSKSGLSAHLNGKKHKIKEARQNRKICMNNKKGENFVNVKTTETVNTMMVHKNANESKNEVQLMETVDDNDVSGKIFKNEKKHLEIVVYKNGEQDTEKSQSLESIKNTKKAGKINVTFGQNNSSPPSTYSVS